MHEAEDSERKERSCEHNMLSCPDRHKCSYSLGYIVSPSIFIGLLVWVLFSHIIFLVPSFKGFTVIVDDLYLSAPI